MAKQSERIDNRADRPRCRKTGRRYYQLEIDLSLSRSPWCVRENEAALKKGFPADSNLPFQGYVFSEHPKISFDRKKRRGPLRDVDRITLGIWLVADRVKMLFEKIDPDGFRFAKVEMDYRNFEEPGPGYWFCEIVRMLDCVDEERSKLTYYDNVPFKAYRALIDVKMLPEVVGTAHAFRLKKSPLTDVVDDVIANAVKAEKIEGFRFVDIQRP